jgi:hypothetical protein
VAGGGAEFVSICTASLFSFEADGFGPCCCIASSLPPSFPSQRVFPCFQAYPALPLGLSDFFALAPKTLRGG